MAGTKTQFEEFLDAEVQKYRGVYVPVKSGLLRRMLTRTCARKKLHPNPDDEFCMPGIGPNYEIIGRYEQDIRNARKHSQKDTFSDRLIIERIRPDGYMILNGHHRWAAAMRCGIGSLPVQLVNLTSIADIRKALDQSTSTKRVTMDLDEVVMAGDGKAEKALPFPFGLIYRERIRLGIPALSRMLSNKGIDLWIYTSRYYAPEYLQHLMKLYHVYVRGVVTGVGPQRKGEAEDHAKMNQLLTSHYADTYHIDGRAIVHINSSRKDFEEAALSGEPETWSREIMDFFRKVPEA